MKISIDSNVKEVTKGLKRFQKKQIPFATSLAINNTLLALAGTPKKMGILGIQLDKKLDRPTPKTKKGFFVIRATKKKLIGILKIKDFVEDYLKFQIDGGIRSSGHRFAIPTRNSKLNKFGNIIGKRTGLIKKNTQFFGTVNGITGVFERTNKNKKIKLIHVLAKSATYKPKFPFYKIGGGYIANKFNDHFVDAMRKALRTAK